MAVVATLPDGSRFLLSLEDVSIQGKSTAALLISLKEGLFKIRNIRKVNSIQSDSASSCKSAREKLVSGKNFAHIIEHG